MYKYIIVFIICLSILFSPATFADNIYDVINEENIRITHESVFIVDNVNHLFIFSNPSCLVVHNSYTYVFFNESCDTIYKKKIRVKGITIFNNHQRTVFVEEMFIISGVNLITENDNE